MFDIIWNDPESFIPPFDLKRGSGFQYLVQ
jgi:hypothetical protein